MTSDLRPAGRSWGFYPLTFSLRRRTKFEPVTSTRSAENIPTDGMSGLDLPASKEPAFMSAVSFTQKFQNPAVDHTSLYSRSLPSRIASESSRRSSTSNRPRVRIGQLQECSRLLWLRVYCLELVARDSSGGEEEDGRGFSRPLALFDVGGLNNIDCILGVTESVYVCITLS
jgi:hypothetical protein